MKEIFLHVGKHKTGTTSLQRYMKEEIDFFYRQGFCVVTDDLFVPGREKGPANCYYLAHLVIRPELKTPVRIRKGLYNYREEEQKALCRRANQILHDLQSERLIISAEAFSFLRTENERARLEILFSGFKVTPILYTREATAWQKSWERQLQKIIKMFGFPRNCEDTIFDFSDSSWLLDDSKLKKFYGASVVVESYEDALTTHSSIIPSFMANLGMDLDIPDWKGYWVNRTTRGAQQI